MKSDGRHQTTEELIADLDAAQTRTGDLKQTVTRTIKKPPGTRSTSSLATLSDLFKRPRLSVGYALAGVVIIVTSIFVIRQWTRATLPPALPEAQQLYDKGVEALHEGSYFRASKLLERAVAADDKFMLAHARLGEAYAELDYGDKAKEQLLSASRLVSDRSTLDRNSSLYFDAIWATVSRDQPAAINAYIEVTRLMSRDASAHLDLGRAYDNNDEMGKAIEQYSIASNLDRTNPAPLLRLGMLYGRRQDFEVAQPAFDAAEKMYKDNQNFEGMAEVSYQRAYLFSQMGQLSKAGEAVQQLLDVAKLADNKYQQVRALLLLSAVNYSSGDTAHGQQLSLQALELARNNDLENLATQGLLDLGYALMIKRSYDESERYLKQGFELAQRFKEKRNEARANLLLGTLYIQKEDADKGTPLINQALMFYRAGGYRREVSRCMMMIGRGQLLKGDFDRALKTLDEQLQLAKQVEDPGQLARSQAEVAAALSKQDLYPQALIRYTESYELNRKLNNPLNAAFALTNRADMFARLGHYDEATRAVRELQDYLDNLSDDNQYKHVWGAWAHLSLARMYLGQQKLSDAKSECVTALGAAHPTDLEIQAEIKIVQGLIEISSGNHSGGLKLCETAAKSLPKSAAPEHRGNVELALAHAQFQTANPKAAFASALRAQQILSGLHEVEREWLAWAIAARSSMELNDPVAAREQSLRATALLSSLKRLWGSEDFNRYGERIDIKTIISEVERLAGAQ